MDLDQAIANLPMFSSLDKKHQRELARSMRTVQYQPGHEVITEGTAGYYGGMGVVLSGSLKVVRAGNQIIGHIRPGEVFGEMSLIDDHPRSATLIAEEPTEAATLSAWHFRDMIRENPDIAMHLLRTLSERLREARANPAGLPS